MSIIFYVIVIFFIYRDIYNFFILFFGSLISIVFGVVAWWTSYRLGLEKFLGSKTVRVG